MTNELILRQNAKIKKKATSLDFVINALCFLSVLFIGADIWGINIGVNIRLDQLFIFLLTACLIIKGVYRVKKNLPVIFFLLFSLISVFLAYSFLRASIFYFSILFNVFLIFYCFMSYVQTYGIKRFIRIFRKTLFIQAILLMIQFIVKVLFGFNIPGFNDYGYYFGIPRFCLWYYEPSYIVSYLLFWFSLALYEFLIYKKRMFVKDIVFSVIAIFLVTSTTGYIGVVFSFLIVYLIWLFKGVTFKKIVILILLVGVAIGVYFAFYNVFSVFVGRIFSSGLASSSGGRIDGWKETFQVFIDYPFFGVGPGNYGLYLFGDASIVPSNVTLELLASVGIFATIAFYSIMVKQIVSAYKLNKKAHSDNSHLLIAMVFGLIIFTIILQVNQGYLRLYHWMFFGVIEGLIIVTKKECIKKQKKTTINISPNKDATVLYV